MAGFIPSLGASFRSHFHRWMQGSDQQGLLEVLSSFSKGLQTLT